MQKIKYVCPSCGHESSVPTQCSPCCTPMMPVCAVCEKPFEECFGHEEEN